MNVDVSNMVFALACTFRICPGEKRKEEMGLHLPLAQQLYRTNQE
jgi:hypothetical protein